MDSFLVEWQRTVYTKVKTVSYPVMAPWAPMDPAVLRTCILRETPDHGQSTTSSPGCSSCRFNRPHHVMFHVIRHVTAMATLLAWLGLASVLFSQSSAHIGRQWLDDSPLIYDHHSAVLAPTCNITNTESEGHILSQ